jgi:HD-like signal output (HDOD) protein
MPALSTLLQAIQLPAMPEVAQALIKTLDDEDVHVSRVRDLIAKDAALTVKLLALANSAKFGLARKVSTLDSAISLVGMSQVRALALSACLHNAFSVPAGMNRVAFWRSSMACAGYAQWIAGKLQSDRQTAWLTGMMLRLGELILVQYTPRVLGQFERLPRAPGERWARQRELMEFDEGQVSSELARRWNFPLVMVDGLDFAAEPLAAATFSPLAGSLHLAGLLADMPQVDAQAIEALPEDLMATLKLDRDWMQRHLPEADSFVDISSI